MEELTNVLRAHAARYPQMQPTDAVKLIYQNEFGGGHMIRHEVSCTAFLHREYEATARNAALSLYEEIGNGIIRVNLAALEEKDLDALGRAFIRSAASHKGNLDSFREKLEILRACCAEGLFSFDSDALDAYLSEYERVGCPPVSHSQAYRSAYHPAYRIVQKKDFSL